MASVPDKETFEKAYAGQPPWDIGRPQPAFIAAAEKVTGSVLDAGCGSGEHALYFAARGRKVTGIDFLEEPIRRARQKADAQGVEANFLVMDALHLRDLPETFNSVIDSGLFHVFSDEARRRYIAGLASIMSAAGRLFLLCFSDEEPGTQGPRRISQAELRQAFGNGWTIESLEPSRFAVVDSPDISFSPGGPKAWFAIIRHTG